MASAVADTWKALVRIWVVPVRMVVGDRVAIDGSAPSTALLSAAFASVSSMYSYTRAETLVGLIMVYMGQSDGVIFEMMSLTSSSAGGVIRAKVEASFWRHANRSVFPTFSLIHLPSSSYSDNNEQSTRPTIIQYRPAK